MGLQWNGVSLLAIQGTFLLKQADELSVPSQETLESTSQTEAGLCPNKGGILAPWSSRSKRSWQRRAELHAQHMLIPGMAG